MSEDGDGPGKNDIVFGIGKFKKLLNQYTGTKKYYALVDKIFDTTYATADRKEKTRLLDFLVTQPQNDWKPRARFFKYDKKNLQFHPLDDKQAREEVKYLLKQIREHKSASPQKKTALDTFPCGNYVVFGIGTNVKMLEKYPQTTEYRKLLHRIFDANTDADASERKRISEKIVSEAYAWKPRAEFLKFHRTSGQLSKLNNQQVLAEINRGFENLQTAHRRREYHNSRMDSVDDGSDSFSKSKIPDRNERIDKGDTNTGSSGHNTSVLGGSVLGDQNANCPDNDSNSVRNQSQLGPGPSNEKKRSIEKTLGEVDDLESEMKQWKPSNLRFKLRKKFLARTIVLQL